MKIWTTATWKLVASEIDDSVAEFIIETKEGMTLCKILMTKDTLWQLAKAAMDTGDYLNERDNK